MEKLVVAFTSGYYTNVVFVCHGKTERDDLQAIFEEILRTGEAPTYGIEDLENLSYEEDENGEFQDMIYVDNGRYFDATEVHVMMLNDEKIESYREQGITVVELEGQDDKKLKTTLSITVVFKKYNLKNCTFYNAYPWHGKSENLEVIL